MHAPTHDHAAGHAHEHAHRAGHAHEHAHAADAAADNERRVFLTLVLTAVFMVAEVAGGIAAGSLALLADAGHMLTDTASLTLAWAAFRIGRRPHDAKRSYGYHRFQVLAAFVNGVALIAVVGWIAIEAIRRLLAPIAVEGGLMLVIAGLGLLVNVAAFAILHGGERENLNIQGAALHVLGDLLGSVAAIVAGGVIYATGWTPIDPLLSVLVALLILRSAWLLVRRSAHILLEGTPDWLDVDELKTGLIAAIPAVQDVHHVHAWMLTSERALLTMHACIQDGADRDRTLLAIRLFLERDYGIGHATIQLEPAGCADEACRAGP
jgi:cobalt-zinc-cadmium efflux system protein